GLLFQRDSNTLVSAGDETVAVWDITTGQGRRKLTGGEWEYRAMHLLPLPGRRVLAYLSLDGKHTPWALRDMSTGHEITQTDGRREPFTVSPDRRILASAKSTITLREVATGGIVGQLPEGHRGQITCLAFAPDGKTLASGGADSTVLVWDWRQAAGLVREPQKAGESDLEEWWSDL